MRRGQERVLPEHRLTFTRLKEDDGGRYLSVLQNVRGLTVANNIAINATNGTGTMTLGGSSAVTSGSGTFSGAVTLQGFAAGSAENKTVTLTSSTSSGNGDQLHRSDLRGRPDRGDRRHALGDLERERGW